MIPLNAPVNVLDNTLGRKRHPLSIFWKTPDTLLPTAGCIPEHGPVVGRRDAPEAAAPTVGINLADNRLNALALVDGQIRSLVPSGGR